MSLCNICPDPGRCCREINISRKSNGESLGKFDTATEANISMAVNNLPFVAIPEKTGSHFMFSCPMLSGNGRCSIYEHRPKLCREYETASDGLCVFYGTNIKNNKNEFYGEGLA